ncbi:hypothetical protein [Saccharopolyspora halophila]
MSAAVSPRLVEVIDMFTARRTHPSGQVDQLEICETEPWGLMVVCLLPHDPHHDMEITWLLTDLGVRMTRLRPRDQNAPGGPSALTAVAIQRDTRTWTTTDLLLRLEIPGQGRPRVTRAAEFASAVAQGAIRQSEADYAFSTVHRTLDEITRHRTINQWLAYRGIFEPW